jgi:transcriptional regulator with XRE-family HTH domain
MNTNTFGHATGFAYSIETDVGRVSEGVQSLQRQLQGFYAQNGQFTATSSPLLALTGIARVPGTISADLSAIIAARPPDVAVNAGVAPASDARAMIDDIQARSGLTLSEIAGLLGTSRRTIQNWRAGERVNSRNDQLLRGLAQAIRDIDAGSVPATRDRLFARPEGQISAYALLAEQRFDTAVAIATGRQPVRAEPKLGDGLRTEVAARLTLLPGGNPVTAGKPSSRRLRRKGS